MSERGEVDRYRMRPRQRSGDDIQFEVFDTHADVPSPLTSFDRRGDAVAAAAMLSQEYRVWQRGEDAKRAIREAASPKRTVETTGFYADYAEARRSFKYTNDLAPKSRWVFTFHYPGNVSDEHEMAVLDEEVPEIVAKMSEAIYHLHEIHTAAIVP